jgi:hypothetical protein
MLENFSRTVRNYVPSSIPIPTPAPPRVSRPISVGSFTPSQPLLSTAPMAATTSPPGHIRRGSGAHINTHEWTTRNHGQFGVTTGALDDVFGSDDDGENGSAAPIAAASGGRRLSFSGNTNTSYPVVSTDGPGGGDPILWSRWDQLSASPIPKRLLFLGYTRGLQIWDCTNLEAVVEVLNLSAAALNWGRVLFAGVLTAPSLSYSHKFDLFAGQRPLIGVM